MPALIFRLDIFGTASTRRVLGADVADVVRSNPGVIVLLFNLVQHVTKAIDGERPCLCRLPLDLDLRVSADFTFYGTPEISEYGIAFFACPLYFAFYYLSKCFYRKRGHRFQHPFDVQIQFFRSLF